MTTPPSPPTSHLRRRSAADLTLRCAAWLLCALLAACAHRPAPQPKLALLQDALYAAPAEVPDPAAVFALSPAMRDFADGFHARTGVHVEPRRALMRALQDGQQLRLGYDSAATRNAAQAFDARSGNCLSLVIMTSAFAKYLGLPVSYQQVAVEQSYTRVDNLTLASGHVNVVLGRPFARTLSTRGEAEELVVDFLPADEVRGYRTSAVEERRILAMYFNNRAAETMTAGRLDDAYAWARAALLQDPGFLAAANTLAVVYLRSGHLAAAEAALRHVLADTPDDAAALSNLVAVLRRAGRTAEADTAASQLARVQPYPPFHFLELGRRALEAGDYRQARVHFASELRRQPHQSEVHFWAAVVEWHLGARDRAADHLRQAMDNSPTQQAHRIYSAKLAWLRGVQAGTQIQ